MTEHDHTDDERLDDALLGDAEESPARRRRGRKFALIFFSGLLVIILGVVGVVAYYAYRADSALDQIKRTDLMPPTDSQVPRPEPRPAPEAGPAPVTFVLIGSDEGNISPNDPGRSDSLMIAHLSGDRKSAQLISIPRDLAVDIPGHANQKINHAYAYGGAPLTVAAVEQLFGVRMDHVAVIDFEGFMELTTALGGVTVFNRTASSYAGYDFPRGEITIEGKEALTYVRQRHGLANGDFDRQARQRAVVAAILEKLASGDTIANPGKFGDAMAVLGRAMTVDNELGNDQIRDLALSIRMNPRDIRSMQVPVGFTGMRNGAWVADPDPEQLRLMSEALRNDSMEEYYQQDYPK
ncbi:LCP family protein [Parenemella sanctibonifatiensis]|uniref:Transcriptional regulator n=1 Tax=Parenemella sanctibonifatiensis TaxID=2016505 RepID=A0A255EL72_9ACTN|nr:LCP family protein [Parenemella sanctibonifatiensis]OYN92279.1 transcriptional regulator [Parenemella sanctibonifatiensis]